MIYSPLQTEMASPRKLLEYQRIKYTKITHIILTGGKLTEQSLLDSLVLS